LHTSYSFNVNAKICESGKKLYKYSIEVVYLQPEDNETDNQDYGI